MLRLRHFLDVSFRAKMLIPVIVVMVLLLTATLMVVNFRFQQQTAEDARGELGAARLRFHHSQVVLQDKLQLWFQSLADEPKYRAAFMSYPFDAATVSDSLGRMMKDENFSEESVSFVFFTRSESGGEDRPELTVQQRDLTFPASTIIASSELAVQNVLRGRTTTGDTQTDTVRIGDKLFNIIAIPVYYPQKADGILGVLTFGVEMDWRIAQEFSTSAGGLTVLVAGDEVIASTLAGNEPIEHLANQFKKLSVLNNVANAPLAIQQVNIGNQHFYCSSGNFPSLKGDKTLGYLLFSSYEKKLQALAKTRVLLLAVSLMLILISSLVVWFVVIKVTRPLSELRDSAEAVGRGDFTRRVPVRYHDECGELAMVFNQMTGNLQQSRAQLEEAVQTLKNTQGQLIQSEKLSAVGEFVAGVAHELNNPLAAVVGFSEMLKDNEVDTKNRRYLDMIFKSAQRCQKIVQALLSFARRHQPERKPMSVNSMVEAVLEMLNYQLRTSNIEVVTMLAPSLPVVLADGHQIQQVLLNVINNARQAMEKHQSAGRIKIITELLGERVRIIIHDNGPGISEENLLRIFDPFFTTKEVGQGTGLGLSLCYGIIKEHGGNITPTSRPGDGAKFTIELPAFHLAGEMVTAQLAEQKTARVINEGAGKKILVVDDEEPILQMVSEGLSLDGYTVDTVSDGEKALRQLRDNHYDVMLCDWKMPGLNGRQIYEMMRAENPVLCQRVVFFSGDVVNGQMREFLEREKRTCLAKPFAFDDVRAAIKKILVA
jgi:signal transduction histidine kinase/ActR/RegA family two-component response regulator